jgi:transposase
VAYRANGLTIRYRRLAAVGNLIALPIAIERPSGIVVDSLIEAGHAVVPIHPNAIKASRPRNRASSAKDDTSDARMLADLLCTDAHRFAPLRPQSEAIRALVRGRDDLVAIRVQLANQLRSLLDGFWPGAAAIFAEIDSPIALAFLARFPTPHSAKRLGEKRLAAFLAQHSNCERRTPAELLARPRAAAISRCAEAEQDTSGEVLLALAATLERLVAYIATATARIRHDVAQLPEGRVVMSFPRAGQVCAAQITAELGRMRQRFPFADTLATEAGCTPVTRQSGKSRAVVFRWACNRRLRTAITCFADNSRRASVWAADVYRLARARGCDHPHALRILARAWIRVLWRAWHDDRPYQAAAHRATMQAA